MGSSPSQGDIFLFGNLIFNGLFYAFLIHVINLRGQDSLKTDKFVQEMSKIEIAIYLPTL